MRQTGSFSRAIAAGAIVVGGLFAAHASPAQQNPEQQDPQQNTAQDPAQQPDPAARSAEMTTATASIQKIDKANHRVTLKDDKGNIIDVNVRPDVKLDQLKVGDKVNASYYQERAIEIRGPGEPAPKVTTKTARRAGGAARQTVITARVVSVDTKNNTLTLRGPRGETHTLTVQSPEAQARLSRVKPGETVRVAHTQALAVSITPAK
jgi:Cu/Ag efflux protein CusF